MNKLPYLNLENDLHLNSGIIILLIHGLCFSSRGNKILTLDKLQTFYFLITRPSFLNKILGLAEKPKFPMAEVEYFTVNSQSVNVDDLFDKDKLKFIIKFLASKEFIEFSHTKNNGFVIQLSNSGIDSANCLSGEYFTSIIKYINSIKALRTLNSSKLDSLNNKVLKQEI